MAKKPRTAVNQAIGTWEAACLMGLHWTRCARMAAQGLLTARRLRSPTKADTEREFAIYSSRECEENHREYMEAFVAAGNRTPRRPRGHIDLRSGQLRRIAAIKTPIAFDDAISTGEAAEILGVHWTFPPRMAAAGKVIGRILYSERRGRSRTWIFSRESCEANAAATKRLEVAGRKVGRPRS